MVFSHSVLVDLGQVGYAGRGVLLHEVQALLLLVRGGQVGALLPVALQFKEAKTRIKLFETLANINDRARAQISESRILTFIKNRRLS